MKDVRIWIGDLVAACRELGEVRVVAAGAMYATLRCNKSMRKRLSCAGVNWVFD